MISFHCSEMISYHFTGLNCPIKYTVITWLDQSRCTLYFSWCPASNLAGRIAFQGMQVSTATQRAATTTRHCKTEKLRGDIYQPVYLQRPAKREGRGGQNCCTNAHFGAGNCTTSQSEYTSSKAQRRPLCQIGVHDLRTPLISIGSILA